MVISNIINYSLFKSKIYLMFKIITLSNGVFNECRCNIQDNYNTT